MQKVVLNGVIRWYWVCHVLKMLPIKSSESVFDLVSLAPKDLTWCSQDVQCLSLSTRWRTPPLSSIFTSAIEKHFFFYYCSNCCTFFASVCIAPNGLSWECNQHSSEFLLSAFQIKGHAPHLLSCFATSLSVLICPYCFHLWIEPLVILFIKTSSSCCKLKLTLLWLK